MGDVLTGGLTIALLLWVVSRLYNLEKRVARIEAKINNLNKRCDGEHGEG